MSLATAQRRDAKSAIQALLLLEVFIRLLLWSASFALTNYAFTAVGLWPAQNILHADLRMAWQWGQVVSTWILLYNVIYVALLVALRLPIPTPRQGRYELKPGGPIDRQLIWAAFIAVLTKARYEAPFPAFLVYHVCSLPPMRSLVGPTLGPRSRSVNVTMPVFVDPHATWLGRNVVVGYGASVSSHFQDRDGVTIARTVIEDDVLIGAGAMIYGGCTIKRGAVLLGGAILRPFTTVGENEVWGGVPAVKVKELPPVS